MAQASNRLEAPVERLEVAAYTIPTDKPESDGTLEWDSTTIVVVHAHAGGERGLGYTYAHAAAATLIDATLREVVEGRDAFAVPALWAALANGVRNVGRPGIAATAISAVDAALWDLKARLLALPLVFLLGRARDTVPVYASGGFTSYSTDELREQLGGWAAAGIPRVKMKVGRQPDADLERVRAARDAIGSHTELFVDANGAYERRQALVFAQAFAREDGTWFEEPVSSDDLEGLRLVREGTPPGLEVAAGEYGYDRWYFRRMLTAGAVDVLQADATRCLGITGFLRAAAHHVPLSAHPRPPSTSNPAAHSRSCATSSGFTTTSASSAFSSTAP